MCELAELLLKDFTLAEILEMCDITEDEVLKILLEGGHIAVPPFLEDTEDTEDE